MQGHKTDPFEYVSQDRACALVVGVFLSEAEKLYTLKAMQAYE